MRLPLIDSLSAAMLRKLLPDKVAVVVAGPAEWTTNIIPSESPIIAHAVDTRRREFAVGRSCARLALEKFGFSGFPVLIGSGHEPLWPSGLVGSITHCRGYCAAAVARAVDFLSLGIDAEVNRSLSADLISIVATESELLEVPDGQKHNWAAVVFSAKEAIFKAWYPLTRRWLDYRDVELGFNVQNQTFVVRSLLGKEADGFEFRGRFA